MNFTSCGAFKNQLQITKELKSNAKRVCALVKYIYITTSHAASLKQNPLRSVHAIALQKVCAAI